MPPLIVLSDEPTLSSTINTAEAPIHVKITPENGSPDDLPRYLTFSTRDRVTIGRASTTAGKALEPKTDNMYLRSPIISRNHAELFTTWDEKFGSCLFIEDMASSHGTYVNKVKLSPNTPHKLASGDSLRFGINISRDLENFDPPRYKISISRDEPVPAASKSTPGMTPGRSFSVPLDLDDDDSDEQSVASEGSEDGSEEHAPESASDPEDFEDEEDEEELEDECEDCEDESVHDAYDGFENYVDPVSAADYGGMGSLVDEVEETAPTFLPMPDPYGREPRWTWAVTEAQDAFPMKALYAPEPETAAPISAKANVMMERATVQCNDQEAKIKPVLEKLNAKLQDAMERQDQPPVRRGPIRIISGCSNAEAPMPVSPIANKESAKAVTEQARMLPPPLAVVEADKLAEPKDDSTTTEAVAPLPKSAKRKHAQIVEEADDAHVTIVSKRPVKKARSHYRTAATAAAAGALLGSIGTLSLLASLPAGFFD